MPQPRRMRDASGLGSRLAGDLEPDLFDLLQEIAGEAGLDAQDALDPLPRLRHDVLVEPLARGVIERPNRDDCPVVGYLEVIHVGGSVEAECLDAATQHARGVSGCS